MEEKEEGPKPVQWTPEDFNKGLERFEGILEKIVSPMERYYTKKQDCLLETRRLTTQSSKTVLAFLFSFMLIGISIMAVLTYLEKIGGESLLFMTGTIVGSLLTLVFVYLMNPPTRVVGEREEE